MRGNGVAFRSTMARRNTVQSERRGWDRSTSGAPWQLELLSDIRGCFPWRPHRMIDTNQLMDGWIMTVSGKALYPLNPRPEDICIEDIAFGLAGEYRFANQCRSRYTVAQHCVLGSSLCERPVALPFLFH